MNRQKIIIATFIILAIILAGFKLARHQSSGAYEHAGDGKIQVVTSFYPLYFFAQQVGGDKAHVTNITPAGGEPHDYEPSPQDISHIEKSSLLVVNGGGLESWGEKIKEILNPVQTRLIVAGDGIINLTADEDGHTIADPHIWLSPALAKKIVEKIKSGYELSDPANAPYYVEQAKKLSGKLDVLDVAYRDGLASCTNRNIVTSHAAFGYLAAAYHLSQISVAGLSPEVEPSPRQLGEVIQVARKNNVKFIFFESLASPKLSETIAREVGAQTLVLNPIEGLTPGEIAQGNDYFTEMYINLTNLERACQ